MTRVSYVIAGVALAAASLGVVASAQQPAPPQPAAPPFATAKVEGKRVMQAPEGLDAITSFLKLQRCPSCGYDPAADVRATPV
jgi:hypothetical protein